MHTRSDAGKKGIAARIALSDSSMFSSELLGEVVIQNCSKFRRDASLSKDHFAFVSQYMSRRVTFEKIGLVFRSKVLDEGRNMLGGMTR